MKFILTLAFLATAASALKANSQEARHLLSNSRALEEGQSSNSWLVDYSIKFESCHTVNQFNFGENREGGGGGKDQQQQNAGNGQQNLVKFKLCPSNKCGYGCKGGEYVAPLNDFVDAYTEWKMNDQEYQCEQIRENCDCQYYNGDEETCQYNCYVAKGLADVCVDQNQQGNNNNNGNNFEFNLQEYLECREIETGDQYNQYFVGPKCSKNGQRINLAVFKDQYCTQEYDDGIFASTYGISLPYSSSSIVAENCVSCSVNNGNNDAYYQDPEVSEFCGQEYMMAAKCESKISSSLASPDTNGCQYINNLALYEVGYNPTSKSSAVGFAVFFGLSTVALAAYVVKLHMAGGRRNIALNSGDAAVV